MSVFLIDLIQLTAEGEKDSFALQVGDIKSSVEPRYYQKWQVAFYAWLLHHLVDNKTGYAHITVADRGFILTPSGDGDLARRHVFDLKPYLASMAAVFENFKTVLASSPYCSFWQLQRHCAN